MTTPFSSPASSPASSSWSAPSDYPVFTPMEGYELNERNDERQNEYADSENEELVYCPYLGIPITEADFSFSEKVEQIQNDLFRRYIKICMHIDDLDNLEVGSDEWAMAQNALYEEKEQRRNCGISFFEMSIHEATVDFYGSCQPKRRVEQEDEQEEETLYVYFEKTMKINDDSKMEDGESDDDDDDDTIYYQCEEVEDIPEEVGSETEADELEEEEEVEDEIASSEDSGKKRKRDEDQYYYIYDEATDRTYKLSAKKAKLSAKKAKLAEQMME